MSWFARSIASSLKLDDDDDDNLERENEHHDQIDPPSSSSPSSPSSQGRGGVKEDISELTKTLTRQLWGVASFLAPPPQLDPKVSDSGVSDTVGISGIRSDFAEIGGKFRSGISKLANNTRVSEITKIASNLLQLGSSEEEEDYDSLIAGVTEEVVAFVRDIASHPETWLDFPLPDDEDDDEFDMSDAQQEHALAVERLAPRLAALRIELCPGYMSEDSFWKIYFVLLHPRLSRHDAELLSTPQIVKARASMTQELQSRTKSKPEQDWSEGGAFRDITNSQREESLSVPCNAQSDSAPLETDKHPILSNEIQVIDKAVVEEGPLNGVNYQNVHSGSSSRVVDDKCEDDGDDWLKEEESSELVGDGGTTIPIETEEDVSFSDLEDDDEDVHTSYKKGTYGSDSSTRDSRDWVQLGRSSTDSSKDINTVTIDRVGSEQISAHDSETKESNDWLNLDDIDVV